MRLILCTVLLLPASGLIVITEISDKGTSNACGGNDWVEIYNDGADGVDEIDLSKGFLLYDDTGALGEDTFRFPAGMVIRGEEYLLLCTRQSLLQEGVGTDQRIPDPSSPQFGISKSDTITLAQQRDQAIYTIHSSVGPLPNTDSAFDVTYARNPETGDFVYTSTSTPGAPNILTPIKSKEELQSERKALLEQQDREGRLFFNMDKHGYPVPGAMDTILELRVVMDEADYQYTVENRTYEQQRPFQKAEIVDMQGHILLSLNSPGNLRPKGLSTLFVPTCLGTINFPFQLDMDSTNRSQTLYGVQRVILRHHGNDFSFSREWAYYRMLARFGLPHLRARKVLFSINGNLHGFYTLMEAPDQEYVFARSFPSYNPESFAMFKYKAMAKDCGWYTEAELSRAESRLYEEATPPYQFESGEHLEKVEELGLLAHQQCVDRFQDHVLKTLRQDVVLAYLRYDRNCGDMMVEEGLMDRDLGGNEYDDQMKDFINEYLTGERCTEGCTNSDLIQELDVDNFLKTLAFYAATLNLDSVINWLNNFYLAQVGDGRGWKIIAYDLNTAKNVMCGTMQAICDERLIHWSIARPTCQSLEDNPIVGPLLSNPQLHEKYLEYIKAFTETIYDNATLIGEIEDHLREIQDYVREDYWSFYGSVFDKEMTPEASDWTSGFSPPLLPFMKARSKSLHEQLEAVAEGTYPRGPHIGVLGDNEAWESCADWRLVEANRSACTQGCFYQGCHTPGRTIESWCDEGDGVCYHGDADDMCIGIPDRERYDRMENTTDGGETFCRFAKGVAVRTSFCPKVGALVSEESILSSATRTASGIDSVAAVVIVVSIAIHLMEVFSG